MHRFGLIGEHLGHSLSVPIHQAIFRRLGIDADYRLIEIPRNAFIPQASALLKELDGFNITIPYKQDIMPLLRQIDPVASSIGAVNTVVCDGAQGFNTDAAGFAAMLRRHGMDPAGLSCYVLGTGGASKAVAAALKAMGAAQVVMVSRNPSGAAIGYDQLAEEFSGLLINCTPAGMWPHPEGCPLTQEALARLLPYAEGVADLIYNPPETILTRAARAAGVPACTGLSMLVAQAVEAERHWQTCPIPDNLTEAVLHEIEEMKLL